MPDNLRVEELHQDPGITWCTIFNTFQFYTLHKRKSSCYFVLLDASSNILGVCHFSDVGNGIYKSPVRGTFAGFELKENNIEYLIDFVKMTEELLQHRGAKQLLVNTAPFQHDHTFSCHLFNTLLNEGYIIESHDLNYSVQVDQIELIEKMKRNNKKRLRKCIADGFTFEHVQTESEFEKVYEIIATNRATKGYPITMTFGQIMEMKRLFPDRIYFFKTSVNQIGIASSVCIKINKTVLYVFYWGDLPGHEQHSPISFVADGIYRFARQNNFEQVDIGTSSVGGAPNFGLIKFKETLGFTESLKLSYKKIL